MKRKKKREKKEKQKGKNHCYVVLYKWVENTQSVIVIVNKLSWFGILLCSPSKHKNPKTFPYLYPLTQNPKVLLICATLLDKVEV
ncbi:hypothetical protein HanIR_Chr11g0537931 [Helianthus annuus]|nr:hypothetical protein HanIR_Chr11g0537931 [Helianthus annuus]